MRLSTKGTVGSFGGRNLIYNKIITRKIEGGPLNPPVYCNLLLNSDIQSRFINHKISNT